MPVRPRRRRVGRIVFWVTFGVTVACIVASVAWARLAFGSYYDPSSGMANTVMPGEHLLVAPGPAFRRGDIIVFHLPITLAPTGATYVKRVIGLPGDHVACCDSHSRITVNGRPLDETYVYPGAQPSSRRFSATLRPGQLWVLGDNRPVSADSRLWGPVPSAGVAGRVQAIIHGRSMHLVQTPATFVADGLAPPDNRVPTSLLPLILASLAGWALLVLVVIGIVRTMLRRRARQRVSVPDRQPAGSGGYA